MKRLDSKRKGTITFFVFILTAFFTSFSFAGMEEVPDLDKGIVYDTMPGSVITKVSYFLKDVGGSSRLHFEVTVKNTSNEPKRFEVRGFILDGPSFGGPFPRKGKPAVVKPGEEASRTFPAIYSELPKGFGIVVRETKYIP